jgi:hypothetical protein
MTIPGGNALGANAEQRKIKLITLPICFRSRTRALSDRLLIAGNSELGEVVQLAKL